MPEAAVNKYHHLTGLEHEVGPAWQVAVVETVAEPMCMEVRPNGHLGLRALPLNPRHQAAAGLGGLGGP